MFVRHKTDAARAIFTLRFFKDGAWQEVAVDDFVPTKHRQPQFAHAKEWAKECWPMVIEKAYAKLHGSYVDLLFSRAVFTSVYRHLSSV